MGAGRDGAALQTPAVASATHPECTSCHQPLYECVLVCSHPLLGVAVCLYCHELNGTGALASRAVVRGGPVVASMLASPLRLLYVVLGMDDMRMLFLMLLEMLGSVLRLYRWLG